MKSLRLALAAAAVASAIAPLTAHAGIQCRIYWTEDTYPVVGTVSRPECAW